MLYHPADDNRILWDTWMYYEKGEFHLFFLENPKNLQWDRIGHAVTCDFIRWRELPPVMLVEDAANNPDKVGLTGSILKDRDAYYMTYALQTGRIQRIGILRSYDLVGFEKFLPEELECEGSLYEKAAPEAVVHWRDPLLLRRGNAYELIVTARLEHTEKTRSGCLARLRSKDLLHWEHLDPIATPFGNVIMEVPDWFEIGGTHYLLYSTFSTFGVRLKNPERRSPTGTFYLVADRYEGPYRVPENNLLIGASDGRFSAYVGRTIPYGDEILLYHQIAAAKHSTAPPKLLRQNSDRSLCAVYFHMTESLKGPLLQSGFPSGITFPSYDFYCCEDEKYITNYGGTLTGNPTLGTVSAFFKDIFMDVFLEVSVTAHTSGAAAVLHRFDGHAGMALLLDYENGELSSARFNKGQAGLCFAEEQTVRRRLETNRPYRIRYISVGEYLEVYVDDVWLFTESHQPERSGQIGFAMINGCISYSELKIYAINRPVITPAEE